MALFRDVSADEDEIYPQLKSESVGFFVPEDQIEVKVHQRPNAQSVKLFEYRKITPYLSLCYEELTRHYLSVSGGKDVPGQVELYSLDDDGSTANCSEKAEANAEVSEASQFLPSSILRNYSPDMTQWTSGYKFSPRNTRQVFHGYVHSDINYSIRFTQLKLKTKQNMFEPLFGSACLYTFFKGDFVSISESFHFDATPEELRFLYRSNYQMLQKKESKRSGCYGSSIIVADASGGQQTHFNTFCVSIPQELLNSEIYLVVQINKILSCDYDRALMPYNNSKSLADKEDYRQSCERLHKFRQPLGVSIMRLSDAKRVKFLDVYGQRVCSGEAGLAQLTRALYPMEGSGSTSIRNDQLEMELRLEVHELGNADAVVDRLRELGYLQSSASITSSPATPSTKSKTTVVILPSQIPSKDSPLVIDDNTSNGDMFSVQSSTLVMRKVMPLIPEVFPCASTVRRQIRSNVDNTLFVYLTQLDRFQTIHRNLSVVVELIELQKDVEPTTRTPFTVLENIYNSGTLVGSPFVSAAYSRVSYHARNPTTLEEFKIRLPDVLTSRHWLKFTALHVHVKPKAKRTTLLQSIIGSTVEKDIEALELGIGFLQLLPSGALVQNAEHSIKLQHCIAADPSIDVPILKIRTHAVCSLVSASPQIQRLFSEAPLALGYMPSSIVPMDVAAKLSHYASSRPTADLRMGQLLEEVVRGRPFELSRHILLLLRIIFRSLVGGTGVYNAAYVNPFRHEKIRCQAFLTLVLILDKVFGGNEKDMLDAYIDYLFDEEMPIPAEYLVNLTEEVVESVEGIDAISSKTKERSESLISVSAPGNSSVNSSPAIETDSEVPTVEPPVSPLGNLQIDLSLDIDDANNDGISVVSSSDSDSSDSPVDAVDAASALENPVKSASEQSVIAVSATDESSPPVLDDVVPLSLDLDISEHGIFDDSELLPLETVSPVKPHIVENPSKRLSWGNFITDSLWATGRLLAIHEVLDDEKADTRDPAVQTWSANCLDEIALHCTLQAERLIDEQMLNLLVTQLANELLSGTDHLSVITAKRYKYDGNNVKHNQQPFVSDKAWFEAMDNGSVITDRDLLLNPVVSTEKSKCSALGSRIESSTHLTIPPPLPLFDVLDGFKSRVDSKGEEGSENSMLMMSQRWWPWAHEVLTYQWCTLLTVYLKLSNVLTSHSVSTIVGSYMFSADILEGKAELKSIRSLMMNHGPLLLKFIFKSLCLRIVREMKRPPVLLDIQYLMTLENLVQLLTTECFLDCGNWISQQMIDSLSQFLCSLFTVVVPLQVVRLMRSALKCVRNRSSKDDVMLRLRLMERFMQFEYFVAINTPFSLDAPTSMIRTVVDFIAQPDFEIAKFTSCGIRYPSSLLPNTLAHVVIGEIILSSKQNVRKDEVWGSLRSLLVRHGFDARFQDKESQQRIVCMYLPLLQEIIQNAGSIITLPHRSVERREQLLVLLYLLWGLPEKVLREEVRNWSVLQPLAPVSKGSSNKGTPRTRRPSQPDGPNFTSRVVSLKKEPCQSRSVDVDTYLPRAQNKLDCIYNLCLVLHASIDTFELPIETEHGSTSSSLLSPSLKVEATEGSSPMTGVVSMSATASLPRARVSIDGTFLPSAESNPEEAAVKLIRLEQQLRDRRQSTKSSNVISTPSLPLSRTVSVAESASPSMLEERRWKQQRALDAANLVSSQTAKKCASRLSSSAVQVVLRLVRMICEETPTVYDHAEGTEGSDDVNFVLRDVNIDDSFLVGIPNLRIVTFLRTVLALLLHALSCNESEENLAEIFLSTETIVRQFGGRIVLAAMEDSLQYWARILIYYFASQSSIVRVAACNFFMCLSRACHHAIGSLQLMATTVLAVINDAILEILEVNHKSIATNGDEDRILEKLHTSVDEMSALAESKLADRCCNAFCSSFLSLLGDLKIVLQADAALRWHATHPVAYDFKGANVLDPPTLDDRMRKLIQAPRIKRKNVRRDESLMNKNVFYLEEVTMCFLRAAEVYDMFQLPRLRMFWLENLARLHEQNSNRAEAAEIRWRIFLLCQEVEKVWQQLWVPRPPLAWRYRGMNTADLDEDVSMGSKVGDDVNTGPDNRNFFSLFTKAMDMKSMHPWLDVHQYWSHLEATLVVSIERFNFVNLVQLAERSSLHLLQIYRLNKRTDSIIQEYNRIANAVKSVNEKGITPSLAMGTFYRIFYVGAAIPDHLRNKEYIFRNANNLHVSEYHRLVIAHVKSVVREGVEVKLVHDVNGVQAIQEGSDVVNVIMNSVKVVMTEYGKARQYRLVSDNKVVNKRPLSFPKQPLSAFKIEDLNQSMTFQYSQPFTLDANRTHAKKIDEQWIKTTVLTVKESFPFVLTRQEVTGREVRILSPIEVAIQDVEDRIETMEEEIDAVVSKPSDANNLMRIIQGSIMPQVNAGAAEVAKTFLNANRLISLQVRVMDLKSSPDPLTSETQQQLSESEDELRKQQELVTTLKFTLLNFLEVSKLLLLKTRRLFVPDLSLLESNSIINNLPPSVTEIIADKSLVNIPQPPATIVYTAQELVNIRWQTEMEKGFKTLVECILPYLMELRETDQLIINRSVLSPLVAVPQS